MNTLCLVLGVSQEDCFNMDEHLFGDEEKSRGR